MWMSQQRSKRLVVGAPSAFAGLVLLGSWFCWEAATVIPGSPAENQRWLLSSASLFLSGLLFGVAVSTVLFRQMKSA
jgi:hypothetical protein